MKKYTSHILNEIQTVLAKIEDKEISELVNQIISANKIVSIGAGRVGLSAKAFAMRLGHLGKKAFFLGDSTVPGIKKGDLLIVASGSGETQTIFDLVEIAKKNGATIALITGNPMSRMGKIADTIVNIPAPSKIKSVEGLVSIQPMTTLNEQCLFIFFDAVVLRLMELTGETHETMWNRHSNLE
jgi:6-phospho-3-hexuloisomerase